MSLPVIYAVALALAALLAVHRGGPTARWVAIAYLAAQLASMALATGHYHHFRTGLFLVDLLLLIGLTWITIRALQLWPAACVAWQFLTVLGHLARLADPTLWPLAYWVLVQWTAWPALMTILIGIWLDRLASRT